VFATLLDGENAHESDFGEGGLIVIGNEANGISQEVATFVTQRVTIPRYGHAESLNAAISTAIILDNIRRS
jgi:TrmH family RNA methyltransferase